MPIDLLCQKRTIARASILEFRATSATKSITRIAILVQPQARRRRSHKLCCRCSNCSWVKGFVSIGDCPKLSGKA